MNNGIIYLCNLASVVNLLGHLGHLRLWIEKQDVSAYGQTNEYYVIDQYDRLLAEWDNDENAWRLRDPVWVAVTDAGQGEPVSFFMEILSEEQIFQLSCLEGFV